MPAKIAMGFGFYSSAFSEDVSGKAVFIWRPSGSKPAVSRGNFQGSGFAGMRPVD
jgi:hypothetical protein